MAALVYGIVRHHEWSLAIALEHLAEVVPCETLEPWPSPHQAICGGVNVRGNIVPVVDLAYYLRQIPSTGLCVTLVKVEGRVFGLRTDGVDGIVMPNDQDISYYDTKSAGLTGLIECAFVHQQQLVYVLALAQLSADIGVPTLQFNQLPSRVEQDFRYVMLLRCGRLFFAINALAVHSTVLNPQIKAADVPSSWVLGSIVVGGQQVPAIDLLAWCGLHQRLNHCNSEAFLLQMTDGLVAMMVEEIIDVAEVQDLPVPHLPPLSLPRNELFSGAIPLSWFHDDVVAHSYCHQGYFLEINHQQLLEDMEQHHVAKLAGMQQHRSLRQQTEEHALLVFECGCELCCPLSDIDEILPWQLTELWPQDHDCCCGLVVVNDQAISVVRLSRLFGLPAKELEPDARLLVTKCQGNRYGFLVEHLLSIEATVESLVFTPASGLSKVLRSTRAEHPMLTCISLAEIAAHCVGGALPELKIVTQDLNE